MINFLESRPVCSALNPQITWGGASVVVCPGSSTLTLRGCPFAYSRAYHWIQWLFNFIIALLFTDLCLVIPKEGTIRGSESAAFQLLRKCTNVHTSSSLSPTSPKLLRHK